MEDIRTYVTELLRWNEKINLTSAKDPGEVLMRHVLDSLVPLAQLSGVQRLLDVGPGGGFPGIPIKIFRPSLSIVLVEARRKKAAFNQHVVDKLGLDGIEVIWARLGDEAFDDRFEKTPFDAIITRAAFAGPRIFELAGRVLRSGGTILLMKGTLGGRQQEDLQEGARNQGRSLVQFFPYRLPGSNRAKNLVLIR
jgi:16S rRNA (guanine527-N7)-methyltransferase